MHLRATHFEHTAEIRGLGFQMHRQCDLETGNGFSRAKSLPISRKNRHMCFYPADLPLSGFPQGSDL